jgi:hypothetical protein
MPLVVKLAKLRVVVYKNTFYLKFNTYVSTRFSTYIGVVLRLLTATKPTDFYKLIYYTSLRYLGG